LRRCANEQKVLELEEDEKRQRAEGTAPTTAARPPFPSVHDESSLVHLVQQHLREEREHAARVQAAPPSRSSSAATNSTPKT
jgi:hypothetical protein